MRQQQRTRQLASRSPARSGRRARRAFTLLEAFLALVLMITLMSGVFGFYLTTLNTRDAGGRIARDAKLSHSILQQLATEIAQASDFVPGDGLAFHGTHKKITILRLVMPELSVYDRNNSIRETLPPAQMDIRRITYELIWDSQNRDDEGVLLCHGLLRTEQKTFDPNPQFVMKETDASTGDQPLQPNAPPIDTELIAPEIKYLRFEYFDGAEWRDRWQNRPEEPTEEEPGEEVLGATGGSLPQAVRITIGQVRVPPEEEEFDISQLKKMDRSREIVHPDRFTTTVYLLQTDQSHLNSRKFGAKNKQDLQLGGDQ